MELNAIEVYQNNIKFYITKIKVGEIFKKGVQVDRFNPETNEGYQRDVSRDRARKFGRFVQEGDTISPLPLLVSLRGNGVSYSNGVLEIPDSSIFWLVDGQHRYEGLKETVADNSGYKDFEMPVVIVVFTDNKDMPSAVQEAVLFAVINKTQKGIRSDLVDRFIKKYAETSGDVRKLIAKYERGAMSILKDADTVTRAIEIVDVLNSDTTSPWFDKIDKPNQRGRIAKQRSFTESLKPVLQDSEIHTEPDEQIAKILNNYWSAFRDLCPEAFNEPEDYVIQKTTGLFVLHSIFDKLLNYCKDTNGNFVLTKDKFKDTLGKIEHELVTSSYWKAGDDENGQAGEAGKAGTSKKSFKQLIDNIKRAIDESLSKSERKVII